MSIDEILKRIMNETDVGTIHALAMQAYDGLPEQPDELADEGVNDSLDPEPCEIPLETLIGWYNSPNAVTANRFQYFYALCRHLKWIELQRAHRPERESSWQLVATAPKNRAFLGAIQLVNGGFGEPFICHYDYEYGFICKEWTEAAPHRPTHWCEIPAFNDVEGEK